ncbi:MAG: endonuclease domain-containing protein [Dehalococcoidia bacterium]
MGGVRGVTNKYFCNDPTVKLDRRRLRENAADAEQKLWSILRSRRMAGLKFFRQYGVGSYILDFHCPAQRLAIEVDGGQHADVYGQQHDAHRDSYLTEFNVRVIRFWNNAMLQNIEGVGERIREEAEKHS